MNTATYLFSLCSTRRAYISFLILLLLCFSQVGKGQVSTYSSIKLQGRERYNYVPGRVVYHLPKRSSSPKVVYIAQSGVKGYEHAFGGLVLSEPPLGTACFVLREKRGYSELVEANAKLIGKPSGLWSFLYGSKKHFKDIKGVNYLGWVSKKNLLVYNHSYVSPETLRPLRYAVGISKLAQLYELKSYLRGDSLQVYSDPYLKERQKKTALTIGELVYAYKQDASGKSILISDCSSLQDSKRKVLGWIPSGMLAEVGQGAVYRFQEGDNLSLKGVEGISALYADQLDTLTIKQENLNANTIFLRDRGCRDKLVTDSLQGILQLSEGFSDLVFPLSVWDKASNRFLNIEGGEISMQDVARIRRGSQRFSCHVVFFESDWSRLRPVLSSFQRLALIAPEYKQCLFSASVIGSQGIRHLAPSTDMASWLDFLLSEKGTKVQTRTGGFSAAMDELMKTIPNDNFAGNLLFIFGSKQALNLSNQQIQGLARRSIIPVFLQTSGEASDDGQDFLLNAKELLNSYIIAYDKYLSVYLVDAGLKRPYLFGDYGSEEKVYLLDAPESSLVMGGIAYPSAGSILSGRPVEICLDTLQRQFDARSKLLLESLGKYETKLGILRSKPNPVLAKLHARDSLMETPLSGIDRNAASDTYYTSLWLSDSVSKNLQSGYLLREEEVQSLLQNYERLLPEFTDSLRKEELSYLRRIYKEEAHRLKQALAQQLLPKHYKLSHLFELCTGVRPSKELFFTLEPRELCLKIPQLSELNAGYHKLLAKRKDLEATYRDGKLEIVHQGGANYYFIPQILLP